MPPKISIIVPIYKVEQYLRQCIDSILVQTYTNLEIVLVDDGSPDCCGKICDEYSEKDNRIKVIHKENGGLSDARNVGIEAATGEFLSFIDADDWISVDMIEFLYNSIVSYDADISCCNYYVAYINSHTAENDSKDIVLLNKEQAIKESLLQNKLSCFAWGKLYKKNIFDNVRYPLGKHYEDLFVIIDILLAAEKIVISMESKYYYRQRKGSIVKSKYSANTWDIAEAYERNHALIQRRYKDLIEISKYRVIFSYVEVLKRIVYCKNFKKIPEYKLALRFVRSNCNFVLGSSYARKTDKVSILILKISVILFKTVYSSYKLKDKLEHKTFV